MFGLYLALESFNSLNCNLNFSLSLNDFTTEKPLNRVNLNNPVSCQTIFMNYFDCIWRALQAPFSRTTTDLVFDGTSLRDLEEWFFLEIFKFQAFLPEKFGLFFPQGAVLYNIPVI